MKKKSIKLAKRKQRPTITINLSRLHAAKSNGLFVAKQRVRPWTSVSISDSGPTINIGTECSGLESVMLALNKMGLNRRLRLRFCTEIDHNARLMIMAHQNPDVLHHDITVRKAGIMPTCDIYAAGFPCQPFSHAGLNQGERDEKGRGKIIQHILDYIFAALPKSFLLENVKGLTCKTHKKTFRNILAALRKDGKYLVTWKVLNTRDFGLPQNRERVCIVGLLRNALKLEANKPFFKWPLGNRGVCASLEEVLEKNVPADPRPAQGTRRSAMHKLPRKRIRAKGIHSKHKICAMDLLASAKRGSFMVDCVPCLTRSRASCHGYWLTKLDRMLTHIEMLRLQGLPDELAALANTAGVSDSQLGLMIGNSMSVNVLVHVLHAIWNALKLG